MLTFAGVIICKCIIEPFADVVDDYLYKQEKKNQD